MPEPEFNDLLEYELSVNNEEACNLIVKADAARASSAYYQGRCETMEKAIAEIKAAHEREVAALREGFEFTLGYLKDRLNRLEVGTGSAP